MAKSSVNTEFDLELKDRYNKAACLVTVTVSGKSLPNMAVLGEAMEAAVAVFQEKISASYNEVPARPIGTPAGATPASLPANGVGADIPIAPAASAPVEAGTPVGSKPPWALK